MKNYSLIEVGARGGLHRSWEGFPVEGITVSFEPEQKEFRRLSKKLKNNERLHPVALWNSQSTQELFIYSEPDLSSLLKLDHHAVWRNTAVTLVTSMKVKTGRLRSFIQSEPLPSFLMIDAQGGSSQILHGAGSSLKPHRVLGIRAEVEFVAQYKNQKLFDSVFSLLTKKGYSLARLEQCGSGRFGISNDRTPFSVSENDGAPLWADSIWLPNFQLMPLKKFRPDDLGLLTIFAIRNGCGYWLWTLFNLIETQIGFDRWLENLSPSLRLPVLASFLAYAQLSRASFPKPKFAHQYVGLKAYYKKFLDWPLSNADRSIVKKISRSEMRYLKKIYLIQSQARIA